MAGVEGLSWVSSGGTMSMTENQAKMFLFKLAHADSRGYAECEMRFKEFGPALKQKILEQLPIQIDQLSRAPQRDAEYTKCLINLCKFKTMYSAKD